MLISGRGSNLHAILNSSVGSQVCAVVSNRAGAAGLALAARAGAPTHTIDERHYPNARAFESALLAAIVPYAPRVIALAGFMRVLTPYFLARFPQQVVNIHPSLLPAFPGLNTHARALAARTREHGCTVHWVSPVCDAGEIIDQARVPVYASDTADTLAARVLAREHTLYPQVLSRILEQPQVPVAAVAEPRRVYAQ